MMNDAEIIKVLESCSTTKGGSCKECPFYAYEEGECQQKAINEAYELSQRQQAEIERLNANMDVMVKEHERLINNTKTEAIRDFAEKLKMWAESSRDYSEWVFSINESVLDNLVKQMTGGEDNA